MSMTSNCVKTIQTSPGMTYEDAEDGTISGWSVFDNTPAGASIFNVYDADRKSSVIELAGSGMFNGYRLRNNDGTNWENSTHFIIEWSMRYSENFVIYIDLETSQGHRYMVYSPVDVDQLGSGEYIRYGIGSDATDGTWQTFSRNLQTDLQNAQPTVEILKVNGFLIRGSGYVDDLILHKDN
jgi:hypothetical protein